MSSSNPPAELNGKEVEVPASEIGVAEEVSPKSEPLAIEIPAGDIPSRSFSKKSRSSDATPSSPQSSTRPAKTRTRSTSSGRVLSLITSRTSQNGNDEGSLASPSTPGSGRGKLDRAALEKPKGKYKSGANWDSNNIMGVAVEPFEETSHAVLTDEEEAKLAELRATQEARAMREVGGTAAVKAHAQSSTIGQPIFSSSFAPPSTATYSRGSPPNARASLAGPSTGQARRALNGSVPDPQSHEAMVAEAGQRILAAARAQAAGRTAQEAIAEAMEVDARPLSPDSGLSLGAVINDQDGTKVSPAPSPTPSIKKQSRRRTFMGFGSSANASESSTSKPSKADLKAEKKNKKKAGASSAASSRRASRADMSTVSLAEASNADLAETMSIASGSGTATPGGTMGRRRRYQDTRQLDLLASEIAAEAMLTAQQQDPNYPYNGVPGSLTPEARRASMMSVLGQVGPNFSATTNSSQASLPVMNQLMQPLAPLTAPQPPFANGGYASGSPGSSRNGSPRISGADLPRFDPRRSQSSLNVPGGSPYATQKAKLSGLPHDMLAGLGAGPYPSLPPRRAEGLEGTDPFGIPTMGGDSPYDVSGTYANRTSVYHTPNQVAANARSRGPSNASTGDVAGGLANGTPKRSVLQMSMHNPETMHQGLTKPLKSGRSTPFGSRAPSRTVTPKTSSTGLKEKAASTGSGSSAHPPSSSAAARAINTEQDVGFAAADAKIALQQLQQSQDSMGAGASKEKAGHRLSNTPSTKTPDASTTASRTTLTKTPSPLSASVESQQQSSTSLAAPAPLRLPSSTAPAKLDVEQAKGATAPRSPQTKQGQTSAPTAGAGDHLSPFATFGRAARKSFFGGKKTNSTEVKPSPSATLPVASASAVDLTSTSKGSASADSATRAKGSSLDPATLMNAGPQKSASPASATSSQKAAQQQPTPSSGKPATVPAKQILRTATSPDVRNAAASQGPDPPVPKLPAQPLPTAAGGKQKSTAPASYRASLPASKSASNVVLPSNRRPGSSDELGNTSKGGKFARFMARFAPRAPPPGSQASSAAAAKTGVSAKRSNAPAGVGASGRSTPADSFKTARDRTASAPSSPTPPKTSPDASPTTSIQQLSQPRPAQMPAKLQAPPKSVVASPSQEDMRIARAYVNPEMSAAGFGTRAAFQSSTPAPIKPTIVTNGKAEQVDAAALRPVTTTDAARSAERPSEDGRALSAHPSEGSQERDDDGSHGSASTRSTDASSAGLALTPNGSLAMDAPSQKAELVTYSQAEGFALSAQPISS